LANNRFASNSLMPLCAMSKTTFAALMLFLFTNFSGGCGPSSYHLPGKAEILEFRICHANGLPLLRKRLCSAGGRCAGEHR
jgi:hypothetical protein